MKKSLGFIIGIFGICVMSCTTRMTDFTVLSTKNVDLGKFASYEKSKSRVVGEHAQHILCIFPLGGPPNLKEAIDRAIEQVAGGIALYDGVINDKVIWIPIFYTQGAFVVEGNVLVDPAFLADSSITNHTGYLISFCNPETNEQITLPIAENEYNEVKLALNNANGVAVSDVLKKILSL